MLVLGRYIRTMLGLIHSGWRVGLCLFLGMAVFLFAKQGIAEPDTVRIGVLAHRGLDTALKMWTPTAEYLTENIKDYKFQIVPLSNDTIDKVVSEQRVEFVLTNPASYATLEAEYGVSRLVTLRNLRAGQSYTKFGALIFTRADRGDINSLYDLKGKTFMAVHPNAFGGWWMAWGELKKLGIDPNADFKKLIYSGFPQDKIVYAVEKGEVDAGTIRTDMLERMHNSGLIDKNKFKVLNIKYAPNFQFLHSTDLYPEWPFSTIKSTPRSLAQAVTIALLKMPHDHPAAKSAKISGWTVAQDYHPVHELMKELRVGPYQKIENIRIQDIASQYWQWMWSLVVIMSVGILFIVYVTGLNKKLKASHELIKKEISERMRAEDESARLGHLLDNSSNEIFIFNGSDFRYIQVNKGALKHLGYTMAEMRVLTPLHIHQDWSKQKLLDIIQPLKNGEQTRVSYEAVVKTKSGESYQIEAWLQIGNVDDLPVYVAVCEDITARKKAERDLYLERQKAKITLQSIGDAVITTDKNGYIEYLNPIAENMTGWTLEEAMGKEFTKVVQLLDSQHNSYVESPVTRCLLSGEFVELNDNIMLVSKDLRRYPVHQNVTPRRNIDGSIEGVVLVFRDVAELRQLQNEMKFQATHDDLTNLNNRRAFQSLLTTILNDHSRSQKCTLLYLDLDQFKIINDTCGHQAGDELLKQVAMLFARSLRSTDTVARLGGDEFAILLRQNCQLQDAKTIACKIIDAINKLHFEWEGRQFQVGVSIGIVSVSDDIKEITEALSMADSACYMAKELGRNRYYIYSPDDQKLKRREGEMHCMQEIKFALAHDKFALFLQPIMRIDSIEPRVSHYEVLLRMYNKSNELVSPSQFIPAAERYQLMSQIDRWVIRNTLFQLTRDRSLIAGDEKIAINVSGQTLADSSFADFVLQSINNFNIDPGTLVFEITETAAIENFELARNFINQLRQIGCQISLDDFGSGMSSFTYLKKLSIDYLKIDGSLIEDIVSREDDRALVNAINSMGKTLGVTTVAEFVKNESVLNQVMQLGIVMAQGYVFAEPRMWLDQLSNQLDEMVSSRIDKHNPWRRNLG